MTLSKINWIKFIRLYDKNASIVILSSTRKLADFYGELISWDFGYIKKLIDNDISFYICKSADRLHDKIVIWTPSDNWDPWRFSNYTETLIHIARQLERQNNIVYSGTKEVTYLENKRYMYERFQDLSIRHPTTYILDKIEDINTEDITFPVLLKGEHSSGSNEIFRINNLEEYFSFFVENQQFLERNKNIILQNLLDIRRDLRVIIIGDEIMLTFWRINKGKEWKPTASKFGATIDFGNFPDQWAEYFLSNFKKLGVTMGAFDVAWDNDDLSTVPYFLEFSPRYSPNPNVDLSKRSYQYGKYKHRFLLYKSFDYYQNEIIFKMAGKYVEEILEENNVLSPDRS